MNIFGLAGHMTHLASVLVLLFKFYTIKSCAGISLKTQQLYAIVFVAWYLDILTDLISLYNTIMKLIFLGSSSSIVWYMSCHKIVRRSYDKDQDTLHYFSIVLTCLLLALVINEKFTCKEVTWTFSLYLEAVAISSSAGIAAEDQGSRNIDNLTGQYVFLLGWDPLCPVPVCPQSAWISGLIQTLLYAAFHLLLLPKLEQQREASVTSLSSSSMSCELSAS